MVVFPNAKINLGLNVIARRPDGYHDLDTIMMPVGWCDIIEIVPSSSGRTTLTVTGRSVDCPTEKNLVFKAWAKLNDAIGSKLPPVDIYLHKIIPDGTGLGGGSSDAAFTLKALDSMFALGLTEDQLCRLAAQIGADCPFFIRNRPTLCRGIGDVMTDIDIDLSGVSAILIAKPCGTGVSTAEAYGGVKPAAPHLLADTVIRNFTPAQWNGRLKNDFEPHIFSLKPVIADIKQHMTAGGAVYASMSGSGSAVYGMFADVTLAENVAAALRDCDCHIHHVAAK